MREQAKELVTYMLCPKDRDKDVIENYTDTLMEFAKEYNKKQLKLCGVIKRFLCWIGLHRYKWCLVFSKKRYDHKVGYEEIDYDEIPHNIDGRICRCCGKEQYSWYGWATYRYSNVL